MAVRCIAGEFNCSAHTAAKEPECLRLGVAKQVIQYHIDRMDPAAAAARAADRARVATESAASEAARVPANFIFVERAGSVPAAAAVLVDTS